MILTPHLTGPALLRLWGYFLMVWSMPLWVRWVYSKLGMPLTATIGGILMYALLFAETSWIMLYAAYKGGSILSILELCIPMLVLCVAGATYLTKLLAKMVKEFEAKQEPPIM